VSREFARRVNVSHTVGLRRRANHSHVFARPASLRGVHVVTDVECGMRWTLPCRSTSGTRADGEVVWSWRPEAGAKSARMHLHRADDGDNKVWLTEESAK